MSGRLDSHGLRMRRQVPLRQQSMHHGRVVPSTKSLPQGLDEHPALLRLLHTFLRQDPEILVKLHSHFINLEEPGFDGFDYKSMISVLHDYLTDIKPHLCDSLPKTQIDQACTALKRCLDLMSCFYSKQKPDFVHLGDKINTLKPGDHFAIPGGWLSPGEEHGAYYLFSKTETGLLTLTYVDIGYGAKFSGEIKGGKVYFKPRVLALQNDTSIAKFLEALCNPMFNQKGSSDENLAYIRRTIESNTYEMDGLQDPHGTELDDDTSDYASLAKQGYCSASTMALVRLMMHGFSKSFNNLVKVPLIKLISESLSLLPKNSPLLPEGHQKLTEGYLGKYSPPSPRRAGPASTQRYPSPNYMRRHDFPVPPPPASNTVRPNPTRQEPEVQEDAAPPLPPTNYRPPSPEPLPTDYRKVASDTPVAEHQFQRPTTEYRESTLDDVRELRQDALPYRDLPAPPPLSKDPVEAPEPLKEDYSSDEEAAEPDRGMRPAPWRDPEADALYAKPKRKDRMPPVPNPNSEPRYVELNLTRKPTSNLDQKTMKETLYSEMEPPPPPLPARPSGPKTTSSGDGKSVRQPEKRSADTSITDEMIRLAHEEAAAARASSSDDGSLTVLDQLIAEDQKQQARQERKEQQDSTVRRRKAIFGRKSPRTSREGDL